MPTDENAESGRGDPLRKFCARLWQLCAHAGYTANTLAKVPDAPLVRSQLYALLNGDIKFPPRWEVVRKIVEICQRTGGNLGPLGNLDRWREHYQELLEWWQREGRALRSEEAQKQATRQRLPAQRLLEAPISPTDGGPPRQLGVITGDIREVRCADVWVNSENTEMQMARPIERAISAVIRFWGARRNGQDIADDLIYDELNAAVAAKRPVRPATVVVTGAGELAASNNVRHIAHVAAVIGEPGNGFRPMNDIGRCVHEVLREIEKLPGDDRTVLFPLLGTGEAGGDVGEIAKTLVSAAANYLRTTARTRVRRVLFLAYSDLDLIACRRALRTADLDLAE